jgi:uncharacterized membrane protein YhaH (DUF805 family)
VRPGRHLRAFVQLDYQHGWFQQTGVQMHLPKLLFSFHGRVGRGAFAGGIALGWALVIAVIVAFIYLYPERPKYVPGSPPDPFVNALPFLVLLLTWSQLALATKRFHDLGKSAWFCLLLPFVITFIYLLLARGEEHENQYGPSAGRSSVGAHSRA